MSNNLIKLTCSSCGANLNLTSDIKRFSCAYCGTEFVLENGGDYYFLKDAKESLDSIKNNTSIMAKEAKLRELESLRLAYGEKRDYYIRITTNVTNYDKERHDLLMKMFAIDDEITILREEIMGYCG